MVRETKSAALSVGDVNIVADWIRSAPPPGVTPVTTRGLAQESCCWSLCSSSRMRASATFARASAAMRLSHSVSKVAMFCPVSWSYQPGCPRSHRRIRFSAAL